MPDKAFGFSFTSIGGQPLLRAVDAAPPP